MTKQEFIKILSNLTLMNRLDTELFHLNKETEPEVFNYEKALDIVYIHYFGKRYLDTYDSFSSPKGKQTGPIAWYNVGFQTNYLKGPKGIQGYIPDAINNTLFYSDLPSNKKYNLLNRMFSDLKKLSKG